MKNWTWKGAFALWFVCSATGLAGLATVDLEAVVRSHPKTAGNRQTLRATQREYEEQRDAHRARIDRLQENFVAASEQAANQALNEAARQTHQATAREILAELQKEEENLRALVARLQRSLNETEILLFEGTMQDVREKLQALVRDRGLTLVLDRSAIRSGAPVEVVLWSAPSIDLTEELIRSLGGTLQPAEGESSP